MNKEKFNSYKNVFISSDIHFNHKNILQYCPERNIDGINLGTATPEQIDIAVNKMNELILKNMNDSISHGDLHIIVGDVCMGQGEKMLPMIERMNGDVLLIKGNHDRTLSKLIGDHPKFVGVHDYYCFNPRKSVSIVLSHFPMASWDGQSRGSIHFHGHLHGAPVQVIDAHKKRIFDVGIDNNNLKPHLLNDVIERMLKIPGPSHDHHKKEIT